MGKNTIYFYAFEEVKIKLTQNFCNMIKLEIINYLLIKKKPRMFDEWQMYPVVWDSIRTDVDHTALKGQYILTG